MDKRIALFIAALVVVPLIAVSIPIVKVEAQNSSVVVSSLYKNATLMVKIIDVVGGSTYYVAAKLLGDSVAFEVLMFTSSTYIRLGSATVYTFMDPVTGAMAATLNFNLADGFSYSAGFGAAPNPSYEISAVFYNYTDTVAMMVIPNNANYDVEAVPAVIKDASVLVTYDMNGNVYGFAVYLSGAYAVFEVYDMVSSPYSAKVRASTPTALYPVTGAMAATLRYDPVSNTYSTYWGVNIGTNGFSAVVYNYTTVIVEELYYNGQLVNSSLWSVASVKTEYVTQTITNTVTTTVNVTTTVINLVPVTQTSYVTETVTVPRAIITTETSIMLVLFMLLLLALGIVLYYLMKRG